MLQRTIHPSGVISYQSPLLQQLAVPHAFTTRIGGISPAPFDSLNLAARAATADPQDDPANVAENYNRLLTTLNLPPATLRAWVRQVHGRSVELIDREGENEYAETLDAEIRDRFSGQLDADAIVSLVQGVLLTIRTADCVPILLAAEDGKTVAAVHAGWRGIVGNITAKTVRTIHEVGTPPQKLVAAIGPAISAGHFEVGEEVAVQFIQQGLGSAVQPRAGQKPHIDLQAAIVLQLQQAGVTRIDTNALCTFRDAADFFSHRRDQGVTGRMASVIMANPTNG